MADAFAAATMLARALPITFPGGEDDKADCLDAIELHMLRLAAAVLQDAYEAVRDLLRGS